MNILYAWTGYRELKEAEMEYPQFTNIIEKHIEANINRKARLDGKGWIRTVLKMGHYDKLVVLIDYATKELANRGKKFREVYERTFSMPGTQILLYPVVIAKKDDYAEVYLCTKEVIEATSVPGGKLHFLLSSGTYAMSTSWILLGKTLFEGASFLRELNGRLETFDIPLDLTVEYIPRRLAGIDQTFHELYKEFDKIVGDSPAIKKAKRDASKAALHNVTVLLTGESGTGKEKFAKAIKEASPRKNKPYHAINCAAIPANLLEDMLFGHVKDAYTGATSNREGLLKKLDGGTLFLDEIGECSPEIQAKLLRVLAPGDNHQPTYREYTPVGGTAIEHSDVRIIAATNRDLQSMAHKSPDEKGSFRLDLLYRISSIVIQLPPLRERKEDIVPIAQALLDKTNEQFQASTPGYIPKKLTKQAINAIQQYNWPGNVRELLNAILRGAVMADGVCIVPEDLGIMTKDNGKGEINVPESAIGDEGFNLEQYMQESLKKCLEMALARFPHNKTKAYKWLGLKSYQALDSKLHTANIKHSFRKGK